jgi:hypothetical protein
MLIYILGIVECDIFNVEFTVLNLLNQVYYNVESSLLKC